MRNLIFKNRTARQTEQVRVGGKLDAEVIMRWYGGYHAGDNYEVMLDKEILQHDKNGELVLPTPTDKR
jgi:hypothetical protein